ncbi:galactose mutarotase [Sphingomonas parva]|uniref:Aldose 1-epimerase n=1 Tax=Sphingomonas parva TaxID=2555898 RepID=A0A4Y8ZSS9_9SPHN|nr:aldose epimerase family protein [Sphingomonas parva]TFI58964.1 galactose mutarotase [Sphingomonas parva]
MNRAAPAVLLAAAVASPAVAASVTIAPYGTLKDGREIVQATLRNDHGMEVRVISYGAIITDIVVPDRQGRRANVVPGFGSLAEYEAKNGNYGFGAAIGRYAGRIAGARFSIDGHPVRLVANDGPNTLHGGPGGFDTRVWALRPVRKRQEVGAELRYTSPPGEQGFPGRLDVTITYTLTPWNDLRIDYRATTDAPTALNLTNHSYFNLAGAGSGSAREHLLWVAARRLVETRRDGIPTGRLVRVEGTPFDFRKPATIGWRMDEPHAQLEGRGGFNHSWALDKGIGPGLAARLEDPGSGRRLLVETTEPALHIYAANWFSGRDAGAQGTPYRRHEGIALETQHSPDSPNRPEFPSTVLRPGQTWLSRTVFRFSAPRR